MPEYIYESSLINLDDRNAFTSKVIEKVGHNKSVLELGCNNGYMTRIFHGRGCRVTGVDFDKNALELAKPFCEKIHHLDLNQWNDTFLQEEKFDVIVLADVLEHLPHPRHLLERLFNSLLPGGYLVASLPNVTHISLVYEMLKGSFEYRPRGLLDDSHLRFFSETGAYHLFESSGYFIRSFDRSFAPVGTTEFDQLSKKFGPELLKFVNQNRNATAYHFVIEALPCNEKNVLQQMTETIRQYRLLGVPEFLNRERQGGNFSLQTENFDPVGELTSIRGLTRRLIGALIQKVRQKFLKVFRKLFHKPFSIET